MFKRHKLSIADLHHRQVIPTWHIVTNRKLQQLTFGHAEIIDALELWNACDPWNICLATLMCDRTPMQARKLIDSGWVSKRIAARMWWLGRKWDWRKTAEMWKRYVRHHTEVPFAVERTLTSDSKVSSSSQINTPWLSHVRAYLISKGNYAPNDFDNIAFSRLVLDYYAILELSGTVTLARMTRTEYLERVQGGAHGGL